MHKLEAVRLDVSRETLQKLEYYVSELHRWSAKINLIGSLPADTFWLRHIVDSAQLFVLRGDGNRWCDLGAGGGLPGMVIAIIAQQLAPRLRVSLVESDARKAAFLRITAAALELDVEIHHARSEILDPVLADTVSARALAPLDRLIGYVQRHLAASGVALLPKGRNHEAEIVAARKKWAFELDMIDSVAEQGSKILCIRHIQANAGSVI